MPKEKPTNGAAVGIIPIVTILNERPRIRNAATGHSTSYSLLLTIGELIVYSLGGLLADETDHGTTNIAQNIAS